MVGLRPQLSAWLCGWVVDIMQISFTVPGEPQGKGRPRFSQKNGRTYTPDKTVLYENLIRTEYLRQCPGLRFADKEPLAMRIQAYYSIPVSVSKKRQQAMEAGEIRPVRKPDADNIIKVVADSLNQAAYRDDADLVKVELEKFYSWQPRIEVEIGSLEV